MSVTTYTRTRRRGEGVCQVCRGPIRPGEEYGELVALDSEVFDGPFVRQTWHTACEGPKDRELRLGCTPTRNRHRKAVRDREILDAIARQYGRRYEIGQRVRDERGAEGTVVGGYERWVCVLLDGQRHDGNHHPLTLEAVTRQPDQAATAGVG